MSRHTLDVRTEVILEERKQKGRFRSLKLRERRSSSLERGRGMIDFVRTGIRFSYSRQAGSRQTFSSHPTITSHSLSLPLSVAASSKQSRPAPLPCSAQPARGYSTARHRITSPSKADWPRSLAHNQLSCSVPAGTPTYPSSPPFRNVGIGYSSTSSFTLPCGTG
jgi:hypothetical protein